MRLASGAFSRYNGNRKGDMTYDHPMPALRQSREDPWQPVGVWLVR